MLYRGSIGGALEMSIGGNLHELRIQHGLTLQDVASAVGVTRPHVFNLEKDNTRPSVDLLINLARFFGVSVAQIIDEELLTKNYPTEVLAISRDIQALSEENRALVHTILIAMKARDRQAKQFSR